MKLSIVFTKTFFTLFFFFTPVWGMLAIIISCLGIFIGVVENFHWYEGMYLGWVTATTVGYGDFAPTKPFTRMLSILISVIGIINTGLIVSIAVEAGKDAVKYLGMTKDIHERVDKSHG